MSHNLTECDNTSTAYFDECEECGELSACICLGSIVDDWAIYKGEPLFTYKWWKDGDSGEGWATTYREAMDNIAHAVKCKEASK